MKKNIAVLLLLTSVYTTFAQNSDTSLISITNYKLFPGTFSWRGTDTFFDMTNWDSSPFTEGHVMQKTSTGWIFRINYRLLFPKSYNQEYEQGYPLLIMLHGAGERGNCWVDDCYCKDCDSNGSPVADAEPQFLNNDHMLQVGGRPYSDAVNLAGSRKVDDPDLDPRAFPGFVVFPQAENYWGAEASNSPVSYAVRLVRLLVKEYNIDPDRIYLTGLSMGGQAVLKALSMADWLFASAIAMSPLSYHTQFDYEGTKNVPIWVFQGGHDLNPKPSHSEALVNKIKAAGGTVRYTFYPDLAHNTWTTAFREPDYFSWLLQFKKNDLHVRYNKPFICTTSDDGAELELPAGFPAYQWEYNGEILPNKTDSILVASQEGQYRGRFSRTSATPSEDDWNDWSAPVDITEYDVQRPVLKQKGTTFLPDLNGSDVAELFTDGSEPYYSWERGDIAAELPDSSVVVIEKGYCSNECTNNGEYKVRAVDLSGCASVASEPKYVFFSNTAPVENKMRPSKLSAEIISSSKIFLSWDDPSNAETGFEIWRKNHSKKDSKWELAGLTKVNLTFFYDTALIPNSEYHYKIRAINHAQRSDYFPGNDVADNVVATLPSDHDQPTPPQNLTGELRSVNEIFIEWNKGSDESGIKEYIIEFDGQTIRTSDTTYTIGPLLPNNVYAITVSTVDISGNISPPSNQIFITTDFQGLFYKHSTGAWKSLAEETLQQTFENPEYRGKVATISLRPRVQEDYFNFEFEGYIHISNGGDYNFYLNSNEGSKLFIDGNQVVDFDGLHGRCTGNGSSTTCPNGWGRPSDVLNLSTGPHLIKVQMFEYTGGQDVSVLFRGPDTGNATIPLPDDIFSTGTSLSIDNPTTPNGFAARAGSMTSIDLTWNQSRPSSSQYEIYCSASSDGPFIIIDRANTPSYVNSNLIPGKTYFYKLRAVTETGSSDFTSVVSARTLTDTEIPTQPNGLSAESGNYGKVILKWNSSTDNVGVKGYEIWANDERIGFSKIPAFEMILPQSGELYTIHVVAVDLSNNKSLKSESVTNELFITDIEHPISSLPELIIFPNPKTQNPISIVIRTTKRSTCKLVLSDLTGKVVHDSEFTPQEEQTSIELRNALTAGVYIVHLTQDHNRVSKKLVFQK